MSREGRMVAVSLMGWLCLLFFPVLASAQASAAIAGTVKDATGSVLPGVTVEVASPALIEKVRSAVSDGTGQFKVVALPAGVYSVTFALTGFNGLKREGIELTSGFTATVNAELKVGTVQETVLVTGQSPLVDVQNVGEQLVMTRRVVDALPAGTSFQELATLNPGVQEMNGTGSRAGTGMGGALGTENFASLSAHGGRPGDLIIQFNGMSLNIFNAGPSRTFANFQDGNVQEYVFEASANSVETESGGVLVNLIPKDGGQTYHGGFSANFANPSFQANNLTSALQAAGLHDSDRVKSLWQANPSFGGPLVDNKLWFYAGYAHIVSERYKAGTYYSVDPGAFTPVPDLSHQAWSGDQTNDSNVRLLWQATAHQKLSFYYDDNRMCQCPYSVGIAVTGGGTNTPDGATLNPRPSRMMQGTWTATLSDHLLGEASVGHVRQQTEWAYNVTPVAPRITEATTGQSYRAPSSTQSYSENMPDYLARGSLSYVSASHTLKFGGSYESTANTLNFTLFDNLTIATLNYRPTSVTYYETPYAATSDMGEGALYGQDQWKLKRLTLDLGARYDHYVQSYPAQNMPPVQYVPVARNFPGATIVTWNDLSPRIGGAYDLFGDGKTAVKASLSRYLLRLSELPNPARTNNTVTRTWTDPNGDFIIQGDPLNPAANGELGPSTNLNFGLPVNPNTYDPTFSQGWAKRPFNWEASTSIQHELLPGVSVTAAFYRRWYGNFQVTDNLLTSPSDFNPYCVTTPIDSRLPGGGGQQICGLYDLNPSKRGLSQSLLTTSNPYGNQYEHWDGGDLSFVARLSHGAILQGGLSTGKTTTDNCDVVGKVDNPSLLYCHVETPFLTQVKLAASYILPWEIMASATVQSVPGSAIAATATFTNAQVFPTLGRNLTNGTTTTVNLVAPGTMYTDRLNQLDLRFSKGLRFRRMRMRGLIDVYNALNTNTILAVNSTYGTNGSSWLTPQAINMGRLVKVGVQVDF